MVACGNAVSTLAEGTAIDSASQLDASRISSFLESLGDEQYHCAELAMAALLQALADCRRLKREPWKKAYLRRSA